MYRAFLDMCAGALEGDLLTVYAPDEITLNRLDNDRVRTTLSEEVARSAGATVRLALRVGEMPKASPQENLKHLLKFGSQFDNIEIQ
jgi:DNA polymerase-3 subunit gamma/tau